MLRYAHTVLFLFLAGPAFAQRDAKIPDSDPEIERKSFIVAPGFEVNLYAADPLLAKPIQMNWDPQGRLWVATSETYPQILPGQKANDKNIILEDTKGVGVADKTTVFADGLLIPTGIEPGDGGAYVANSTELVHLSASKPGGKADIKKVLLSGFGTEDTHHIIHTFRWGPDGCLYFNQSIYIHSHIETPAGVKRLNAGGIWKYNTKTNDLNVFARGWVNAWGHAFDKYGQSFVTDGAGGEGINHVVPGGYYLTSTGPHVSRILHGLNPGSPKYCGLEILSGRHLPDDWQGNLITNDFRGHRVCRFVLSEDGSTYASREMPELIKTTHPAFRPIDVKMGPDGAIYIADWYNPIIQHGEVDFRDPRRDHTHGRIWRITAKGRPLVEKPKLVGATVPELLEKLKEPEDWTRAQARRVLKELGVDLVGPAFTRWKDRTAANDPQSDMVTRESLWLSASLGKLDPSLVKNLATGKDPHGKSLAARYLPALPAPMTGNIVRIWFDVDRLKQRDVSIEEAQKALTNIGINSKQIETENGIPCLVFPAANRDLKDIQQINDLVIKDGIQKVLLSDLAKVELGRQTQPQVNPTELLRQLVADDHPQVRLETIRALATQSTSQSADLALSVLNKPMDPTLDYALWLTLRELEPVWLPAFQKGELTFGGDPKKIAFALSAAQSPDAVKPLAKLIAGGTMPKDKEHELYLVLARIGGPEELAFVLNRASNNAVNAEDRLSLVLAVEQTVVSRKIRPPSDLSALDSLMKSKEHSIRRSIMKVAGLWKLNKYQFSLKMMALAGEPDDRLAAVEAIAAFADNDAKEALDYLAGSNHLGTNRPHAIVHQATLDLPAAAKNAAWYLSQAKTGVWDGVPEIIAAFTSRRGGGISLANALKGKEITSDTAKTALARIRSSGANEPALVAALTAAGKLNAAKAYPTEAEIKSLAAEVIKSGNAARGEAIYRRNDMQCLKCHAIAGAGGLVGPDMTSLGASAQVDYLVESLLNPNAKVKEGYNAIQVTTLSGKQVQGVKIREADGVLVLRNAEDKEELIRLDDIDARKDSRSLMPDGLVDPLTQSELIDLTKFLSELGKVGPYAPNTARLFRKWEYIEGTGANTERFRRARIAVAAEKENGLTWTPTYTKVSGELPLNEISKYAVWQNTEQQSVIRCHIDVTTAGPVRLKLNEATGLTVFVNGKPTDGKAEFDVDLPVGQIPVTMIVDRGKRTTDVKLELLDAPNSPARAKPLGGK